MLGHNYHSNFHLIQQWFSSAPLEMKLLRILLKGRFLFPRAGWGLRCCISHSLQISDAAEPVTVFCHIGYQGHVCYGDAPFYTIFTEVRQTRARNQLRADFFFQYSLHIHAVFSSWKWTFLGFSFLLYNLGGLEVPPRPNILGFR